MLSDFTTGNPELLAKMNELTAIARKVENISGGGGVTVKHTSNGINISSANERNVPSSGPNTRWAVLTQDAPTDSKITGELLSASTGVTEGVEYDLYAEILNATRLDMAMPRLSEDDVVEVVQRVYDNSGTPVTRWYIRGIFYGSDDHWDMS